MRSHFEAGNAVRLTRWAVRTPSLRKIKNQKVKEAGLFCSHAARIRSIGLLLEKIMETHTHELLKELHPIQQDDTV